MIIRNSPVATTRRSLPALYRSPQVRQAVARAPLDAFESVAPVAQQQIVSRQQPVTATPTTTSSGGFFSNLFGAIKRTVAGWLGSAGTWLSQNMGGLIDKAKDVVGGWLTKAGSWVMGLLSGWKQKLES